MDNFKNKQVEMDLRMCLATISGYHEHSHSTQILISKANNCVTELVELINTPKHETVEELREVKNLLVLKTKDLNDIIKKYDYMNYTCLQCDYFSFGMAKYTNKQDPDCKLHKRHTQSHCRCKDLKREGLSD